MLDKKAKLLFNRQNQIIFFIIQMRSNKQIPKYKLSITNLVLVNDVYPSDFFIRVRTVNSQDYQDSPVILANQSQCQEVFPWEFAMNSIQIKIQFVQISNNSRVQVVRSHHFIQDLTDQDGEPVALLANRTGKKLCIVTYKLEPYSSMMPQKQSPKPRIQTRKPYKKQPAQQQSPIQRQKKVILSKQEHEELSRQIANINKSIEKILDHQKTQHALFSKYLDQSTSFIKQMMNQSKDSRINVNVNDDSSKIQQASQEMQHEEQPVNTVNILKQIQQGEENQEHHDSRVSSKDELSSKKWYQEKYKKDQPQISSNKDFRKQKNVGSSQPLLQYSENGPKDEQSTLILSNLSFNTEILPKQVTFIGSGQKDQFLKMKAPNQGMYQWKKIIEIPQSPQIIVSVEDEKNKKLEGCIGRKQLEKQILYLYDQNGKQKGYFKFKHKILQIYSVQTHELLSFNRKPQQQQENNDNDKTQDSPKQKNNEQVFATNPRKSSKLRKMSQQQRNNQTRNSLKQEMQNKQDSRSPASKSNRCDLISNSVSASFVPFMKKQTVSQRQQYHNSAYVSDSEPSQINSTQFLSRIKLINLKINTISVKMNRNSIQFVGKFIRMSMRNKQPIDTEIINLSQNLTWKGKGYVFDNVSPYSELRIQLCNNQESGPKVIGTAKVCLALLNLQKQNNIQFYHQFVRDQKQNQIGQLILGYENIDKNRRSHSAQRIIDREDGFNDQQIQDNLQTSKQKKRRKLKSKPKSKSRNKTNHVDEATHRTETKNNNIGNTSSQAKSLVGSASVIRTKKYTGGNIIIGRAARFRFKQQQKPGPGEYEMPSYFQRHVAPM